MLNTDSTVVAQKTRSAFEKKILNAAKIAYVNSCIKENLGSLIEEAINHLVEKLQSQRETLCFATFKKIIEGDTHTHTHTHTLSLLYIKGINYQDHTSSTQDETLKKFKEIMLYYANVIDDSKISDEITNDLDKMYNRHLQKTIQNLQHNKFNIKTGELDKARKKHNKILISSTILLIFSATCAALSITMAYTISAKSSLLPAKAMVGLFSFFAIFMFIDACYIIYKKCEERIYAIQNEYRSVIPMFIFDVACFILCIMAAHSFNTGSNIFENKVVITAAALLCIRFVVSSLLLVCTVCYIQIKPESVVDVSRVITIEELSK